MSTDPINPPHYRSHPSGVEAIEVTEWFTFCLGNAIKYIWRAGLKGDSQIEDFGENWTRAERLAEAQVHATLAVAAAYRIDYEDAKEIAHGARSEDGREWNFINADAFTGSERADEVGA